MTSASDITDDNLTNEVKNVLKDRDLSSTSMKEVRAELEKVFGLSPGGLDARKDKIKEIVSAELQRLQVAAAAPPPQPAAGGSAPAASGKAKRKKQEADGAEAQEAENAGGRPSKAPRGPSAKERQSSLMSKEDFMKKAKSFKIQIGNTTLTVNPKEFSTGSCGFSCSSKVVVDVDGAPLTLQCSLNLPVIGSKEWS
eukprot:TRINITY_DN6521_c0_g1_i1.p2 TRINITY_DN6521_c0_g1~~TRINITY_DN6521_c0_g1_i1.p2  ORF type:complete len:197 (-),score=56.92 TRINITY_DN6521_c0_g1_i1:30-620(-)